MTLETLVDLDRVAGDRDGVLPLSRSSSAASIATPVLPTAVGPKIARISGGGVRRG